MKKINKVTRNFSKAILLMVMIMLGFSFPTYAHCDSYDGPVIKDAYRAIENKDVAYVLKWIDAKQEKEITDLFNKTIDLRNGDAEIYSIVEKHFLETLVRYHRETEGAPFTGLKPAGSTAPIVQMADKSIENREVATLLTKLGAHIQKVITEKHEKVNALSKVKDNSTTEGRAYVEAYVDYTHTLEALEAVMAHGGHH